MIHLRLAGGLGNQLYQLAAALRLTEHHGQRLRVLTGALARYDAPRQPDALRLLRLQEVADSSVVVEAQGRDLLAALVLRGRAGRWWPLRAVNDSNFWARCVAAKSPRGAWFMDGYFQTGWTWQRLAPALRLMASRLGDDGTAGAQGPATVHVRGGDFLKLPSYDVATQAYYQRALAMAHAQGERDFEIVTDDPAHARQLLAPILDGLGGVSWCLAPAAADPLQDFQRLRRSRFRVIGNSTFAWWAAALDALRAPTVAPSHLTMQQAKEAWLPWEQGLDSKGRPVDAARKD